MKIHYATLATAFTILGAIPCWATATATVAEDFTGTFADAAWRETFYQDEIVPDGGNPGAFLRVVADTDAPRIYSTTLPWVGRYALYGTISLAVDVKVFAATGEWETRPVSLHLVYSENGTPNDPSDDCELASAGRKLPPKLGSDWRSFEIPVHWRSEVLPPGWVVVGDCSATPDEMWRALMQGVGKVNFRIGEPGVSYPSQLWDVGFDNPRITYGKFGI